MTKDEKAKFTKHLHEICSLNDEYEFTLNYDLSKPLIEADEECVVYIYSHITERHNPLHTSSVTKLTNLVIGKERDKKHQIWGPSSNLYINKTQDQQFCYIQLLDTLSVTCSTKH